MANNLQRKTNRTALNVSQVEKEIRELRVENEYLKAVLENKKRICNKEKNNLQVQLEDLKKEKDISNKIVELRSNNEVLAQEVREAASEVLELTEISSKLQKHLEEMKALQNENESLQQKLDDLRDDTDGSGSSEASLERERLTSDIVEMKHRLNELIKERDNARAQFDEAKKKLEKAKEQLE